MKILKNIFLFPYIIMVLPIAIYIVIRILYHTSTEEFMLAKDLNNELKEKISKNKPPKWFQVAIIWIVLIRYFA